MIAAALLAAIMGACPDCDVLYVTDCDSGLWRIDPATLQATFVGNTPEVLFDLAVTPGGRFFGIDSSNRVWQIDPCTAEGTFAVGGITGNGLAGDLTSERFYAQGPPLSRVDPDTGFPIELLGGAIGSGPPDWCGSSSGDLALSPLDGRFYSTLACPGACLGGDRLVVLSPSTGEVLAEVGCVHDATGTWLTDIHGVGFDANGKLWAVRGEPRGEVLRIDLTTAEATRMPVVGGYVCGFGLAVLPCGCRVPDIPPPDQGNVVRAVKRGVDVRLEFAGAPATAWRVYRDTDTSRLGVTERPPDVAVPTFLDGGAVLPVPSPRYFYQLRGLSPCTNTPGA